MTHWGKKKKSESYKTKRQRDINNHLINSNTAIHSIPHPTSYVHIHNPINSFLFILTHCGAGLEPHGAFTLGCHGD